MVCVLTFIRTAVEYVYLPSISTITQVRALRLWLLSVFCPRYDPKSPLAFKSIALMNERLDDDLLQRRCVCCVCETGMLHLPCLFISHIRSSHCVLHCCVCSQIRKIVEVEKADVWSR